MRWVPLIVFARWILFALVVFILVVAFIHTIMMLSAVIHTITALR